MQPRCPGAAVLEEEVHPLVACEEVRDTVCGGAVDAEEAPRHEPRIAQHAGQRHVDTVVVVGREIDRGEAPAAETGDPVFPAGEQRIERVVPTLGLQQAVVLDVAELAHRAIDRAGEGGGVGGQWSCAGLQRAREERVEGCVGEWIGAHGIREVGSETAHEGSDEQVLEPGRLAACGGMHEPRDAMLRQHMLQGDESARAEAGRGRMGIHGAIIPQALAETGQAPADRRGGLA